MALACFASSSFHGNTVVHPDCMGFTNCPVYCGGELVGTKLRSSSNVMNILELTSNK